MTQTLASMRATPRRFPALGWRGRHSEADGMLRGYGEAPVGGKCDDDLDGGGGSTVAEKELGLGLESEEEQGRRVGSRERLHVHLRQERGGGPGVEGAGQHGGIGDMATVASLSPQGR